MQAAVRLDDRHPADLADRPDRIEVSEEQDLLSVRAAELSHQMIAAIRPREPRDAAADRLEPRGELAAAAIDRCLVGRRRFEADQRFDRRDEPRALAAA